MSTFNSYHHSYFWAGSSVKQAGAVLMARFARDLQTWLDCTWVMALSCTDEGLIPLCVIGPHLDLDGTLRYIQSAALRSDEHIIRAPEHESKQIQRSNSIPQLICPIAVNGKTIGLLAFGPCLSDRGYRDAEIEFVRGFTSHLSTLLSNEQLCPGVAPNIQRLREIETDQEQVRAIQDRLCPRKQDELHDLDYYAERYAGQETGSSFFDFVALQDSKLVLFVGDVLGRGAAAGVIMAAVQASVRSMALSNGENVAAGIGALNDTLWEISPEDYYTSLFYTHVDPSARQMRYVNAAHEPVLLIRTHAQRTERLENTGTVLGLSRGITCRARTVKFGPGDTLVAISNRAADISGADEWRVWEASAVGALRLHPNARAGDLAHYIVESVTEFRPGAVYNEETTLAVVRFKGAEGAVRIEGPITKTLAACAA